MEPRVGLVEGLGAGLVVLGGGDRGFEARDGLVGRVDRGAARQRDLEREAGGIFVARTPRQRMRANLSESIALMLAAGSLSMDELLDARGRGPRG